MKHLLFLLWLVVFVQFIASTLCAEPDKSLESVIWGSGNGLYRLGIKNFPTTAPAGVPIDGVVVLENTSKDVVPIMLQSDRPVSQLAVAATIDDGRPVSLTSYMGDDTGWSGRFTLGELAPSKRFEIPVRLTRLLDMTRSGYYTVRFSFSALSTNPATQPSGALVFSKAILIHVMNP